MTFNYYPMSGTEDFANYAEWIEDFTYPGWTFEVKNECLECTFSAPDNFQTGEVFHARWSAHLTIQMNYVQFGYFIAKTVIEINIHEALEKLKRGGNHVLNPHDYGDGDAEYVNHLTGLLRNEFFEQVQYGN